MSRTFTLTLQEGLLAICRLPGDAPEPSPPSAGAAPLYCVVRGADELSVVCAEADVPPGATHVDRGWRALTLAGTFDLTTEVGVLLRVLAPLAEAGVGIFAVSTYDTDHVLVREAHVARAIAALHGAGHAVVQG